MVEAARRTKRVVQVGTHRRSGALYADAVKLVQDGTIGKVTVNLVRPGSDSTVIAPRCLCTTMP